MTRMGIVIQAVAQKRAPPTPASPRLIHTFLTVTGRLLFCLLNRPPLPTACGGRSRNSLCLSTLMAGCRGADHGRDGPGPSLLSRATVARFASARYGDRPRYRRRAGHFSIMAMLRPAEGAHRGARAVCVARVAGGLYLLWLGYKIFSRVGAAMDFSASLDGRQPLFAEQLPRRGATPPAQQSQTALVFAANFYRPAAGADPHRLLLHRAADELSDRRQLVFAGGAGAVCRPPAARLYLRLKRRIDIASDGAGGAEYGLSPPSPLNGLRYRCEYRYAQATRYCDYSLPPPASISLLAATTNRAAAGILSVEANNISLRRLMTAFPNSRSA